MTTRREMMKAILAGSTAFAAASVFASAQSELAIAAESGGDKGVTVTPVFEHALADFPGHKAVVVKVDYAPGTASSAHHHPGSVFGYVLDGEIESANGSDAPVTYKRGQMWYEMPASVHRVSRNASASKPASLLAFLIVPDGQAPTTFERT